MDGLLGLLPLQHDLSRITGAGLPLTPLLGLLAVGLFGLRPGPLGRETPRC
jgi:hypothetical protein